MGVIAKSYAKFTLNRPVYLFHHMPKCGGSSVAKALRDWFSIKLDYYHRNENKPDETVIRIDNNKHSPVDLSRLNHKNCVCGHFGHPGYRLNDRYPQIFTGVLAPYRYRVFSFVRDPLEMRCSLYRHQLKNSQLEEASLFANIMLNNNYFASIYGVNESNFKAKLDQYYFIGLADDLQNSFDQLADKLKKNRLLLPTMNTSQNANLSTPNELTSKQILQFKEANALDYQIYDYVRNRMCN